MDDLTLWPKEIKEMIIVPYVTTQKMELLPFNPVDMPMPENHVVSN